jgi:hypothetical protein
MFKQTFTQMSEISVGIAFRRDSLVHLHDMYAVPRNLLLCEIAKHNPRGLPAADCHHELAPSRDPLVGRFGN